MITQIISKVINLQELEQLQEVKSNLFKVVRKHKRKLIRTRLYLNWEIKYEQKTVVKWVLRTVTGRLWGSRTKVSELTTAFNQLTSLIQGLERATKNYLELVKKI